nr:TIGR02678 family protein [Glycomyces sp. L485]
MLKHPFVTASHPDRKAIGRVRQFSETLARDLNEAFGYQLVVRGDTARLLRIKDRLDTRQPARTRTGREFDRRRYAFLSLITALLARCGVQTTVGELAELLKGDANRIGTLGFDDDRHDHRRAFVDVVGWLEDRGVLHAADGSSEAWVSDPDEQDALFDVDRDALFALWRSRVMLQAVSGVADLLGERVASDSQSVLTERAGQAARRAVAEQPVAYFAEYPETVVNHLRGSAIGEDLQRLTGLVFERRREGVLLVDTARTSVEAFPREGAVANAALLLLVACGDEFTDPDTETEEREVSAETEAAMRRALDEAIPDETRFAAEGDPAPATGPFDGRVSRPFLSDQFVHDAFGQILTRFAKNFGRDHHEAPMRLLRDAIDLLERFRLVRRVEGGIVLEPLAGRYRNTVFRKTSRHA